MSCELCETDGGQVLWRDPLCRVVLAANESIPGFCRVITTAHVAEATDLGTERLFGMMRILFATERAVRDVLRPDKINLASLGNVVPHLHWHVIPRWRDDAWFPAPIWAPASRAARPRQFGEELAADLARALERQLGA